MTTSESKSNEKDQPQNNKTSGVISLALVREVFIVILGALVALAADDWQEANERAERDQQVLSMLKSELQTNLQHITDSGDYHQKMLKKIDQSIATLREENRFELPDGWQDEAEITTINSAFQVALLSGTLSRIDPQLALKLSSLYDELAAFDERRQQIDLSTIQTSFNDGNRYLTLKRVALGVEVSYIKVMTPRYLAAIDDISSMSD